MFPLRTEFVVFSHYGPTVFQQFVVPGAGIDHGFNGKDMPWFDDALSFVVLVVRHVGDGVKETGTNAR